MPDVPFENAIPVLPVSNLEQSVEFYQRVLGLELQWTSPKVCSVGKGPCNLMLSELVEGSGATVWIGLHDASLFPTLLESGVTIVQSPTTQPWAYEMRFADPDGNVLWLGAEPEEAELAEKATDDH